MHNIAFMKNRVFLVNGTVILLKALDIMEFDWKLCLNTCNTLAWYEEAWLCTKFFHRFQRTQNFVLFMFVVSQFIIGQAHVNQPGPRLNIKTVLSAYGDFHVKDKTAVRTSYL